MAKSFFELIVPFMLKNHKAAPVLSEKKRPKSKGAFQTAGCPNCGAPTALLFRRPDGINLTACIRCRKVKESSCVIKKVKKVNK